MNESESQSRLSLFMLAGQEEQTLIGIEFLQAAVKWRQTLEGGIILQIPFVLGDER